MMASVASRLKAPRYFESPIMNVHEVAQYLGVHPTTIYRMLSRKLIPAFKLGSDWRFSKKELERWINAKNEGS